MLKVGDKVVITNECECYESFEQKYNELKTEDSKPFIKHRLPYRWENATVKNVGYHEEECVALYLIETDKQSYIFDGEGIELYKDRNEEQISTLEDLFGIKNNQQYVIVFKHEIRNGAKNTVKGEILNFCPSQIIVKSEKGLYILQPMNILEMTPYEEK